MSEAQVDARTSWNRPGLGVRGRRLTIAGRDDSLAREHGTPLYVHDLMRVSDVQPHSGQGRLERACLLNASMTSEHCLRPAAAAVFFADRV